jgi:hypothetical protein
MDEQLMHEVSGMWNWMLNQLGWSGELGWFKIAILVLALLGVIFLMRRLFGSSPVGGGGGSSVIYPSGRQTGFPTSFYVGDRRLGDFSVPKSIYDFKVPTSTPDLSNLRKPVTVDLERARKLFIPPRPDKSGRRREAAFPREEDSEKSPGSRQGNGKPRRPHPDVKLDWDLAEKLFIPNFAGKNGQPRRR